MARKIIILLLTIAVAVSFPNSVFAEKKDKDYQIKKHYRVMNNENKIALTFDDGPHPYYTDMILDILKKYNIKATFFVIGENIQYYKEPLKRVAAEGHEIGNHTYSHCNIDKKSNEEALNELEKCRNKVNEICKVNTKLFRPPQGLLHNKLDKIADNYDVILWSIDTRDWEHKPSRKIADEVLCNTKSGDIILMHDYIGKDSPTPEALEIIIPELLKRNFHFVTVSELLECHQ